MTKCLILAALALAAPAAAQTQTQLNTQEAARYHRADAALNAQYRVAMAQAKADGTAAALLSSQRAWLQFRDAECRRIALGYRGGSMQPMQQSGCLAQLTDQRTRQLKGDAR